MLAFRRPARVKPHRRHKELMCFQIFKMIDHGLQDDRVVGDLATTARDGNGVAGMNFPGQSQTSKLRLDGAQTSSIFEQRNVCFSLNIDGYAGVSLYIRRGRKRPLLYLGSKSRDFAVTDQFSMVTAS